MPKINVKSLRCTFCATNWPNEPVYSPCCECGETPWESTKDPISEAEAKSRKSHAEFDRYCAKRAALQNHELARLDSSLAQPQITQTGLPTPRERRR